MLAAALSIVLLTVLPVEQGKQEGLCLAVCPIQTQASMKGRQMQKQNHQAQLLLGQGHVRRSLAEGQGHKVAMAALSQSSRKAQTMMVGCQNQKGGRASLLRCPCQMKTPLAESQKRGQATTVLNQS